MADHRRRAAFTLFLLAPFLGEVLSGSTPILLMVLNPLNLFFLPALYGCGALLIREVARRRGLGWPAIVLLGAAYGVVEEGLVVTSWFNLVWPDGAALGDYARWLDLNWLWALHLTAFHAVYSTSIPILLTELLFPSVAGVPWLRRRGLVITTVVFVVTCLLGLLGFGFLAFRDQGYGHPPATFLLAVAITALLILLGVRRRPRPAMPPTHEPDREPGQGRPAPRAWRVRSFAFLAATAVFVIAWASPHRLQPAVLSVLLLAVIVAGAWWRVARWSIRPQWSDVHRLALAGGALGFLLLLAPLEEFGGAGNGEPTQGQTAVALATLVVLVVLARRVRRRQAPAPLVTAP